MKFKPTEQQNSAIKQNTPLLVCAAAGSGKTAVLAKRAARLLCDDVEPVSADKLLVVTFTNSAAAEMRDRIEGYVDEVCEENPDNKYLLKQKLMLETAKICTIDSFCIDFVRENSEAAGVEHDFRMLDQFELEDLCDSAITSVFNAHYLSEEPEFLALLDAFGADYGDSNLAEAVKYVYNFSRNIPFPDAWLDTCADRCAHIEKINESYYAEYIYNLVKKIAELQKRKITTSLSVVSNDGAGDMYNSIFGYIYNFFDLVEKESDNKNWNGIYAVLQSYSPDRLPTVRDDLLKPISNAMKTLKADLKAAVAECGKLIYACEEEAVAEQNRAGHFLLMLIKLTKEVGLKISELMKERNAYTFYNTEQMTLELLAEYKDGKIVPTALAHTLQEKYAEVMVDEYQDVNDLQDTIFSILSDDNRKLFAVGDDKQSIYGFRGSNPENFKRKMKLDKINRVDMSGNFRSREKICRFINDIFSVIYPEYTENVYLDAMGDFAENNNPGCEVLFSGGELTPVENEAEAVAKYIIDITKREAFLRDGQSLRKAIFGDIAVLMPTVKGKISAFLKAFKKYNIPVCSAGSDFASSPEVLVALSLLRISDNPSYDAAALSVMMSHIGGFTAEDVAKIRVDDKKRSIYASVLDAADKGDEKCRRFVCLVNKLRSECMTMQLSAFVDRAFRLSGIYELICAYGDGELRRSNLMVICDMAVSFEKSSGSSLSRFLAFMDRVLKTGFESPVVLSGVNSVKLMSIHASKGLQFPVCIVSGMSEKFNMTSGKNSVAADDELGLALRFTEEEKREKFSSPAKLVMGQRQQEKLYDEKKRLLYVALTRAEELLVLSVNNNYTEKALSADSDRLYLAGGDSWVFDRIVGNFASMVIPVLLTKGDGEPIREHGSNLFKYETVYDNIFRVIYSDFADSVTNEEIKEYMPNPSEEIMSRLKQAFSFDYPYKELNNMEIKTSVSALVRGKTDYGEFSARPAFMSKYGLTPAQRGTAMHRFLEVADYSAAAEDLDGEIERLVEYEFITEQFAEALDRDKLKVFLNSELYKRYISAEFKKREMRFLTEMEIGKIKTNLPNSLKKEKILVQGAVDMLFVEDGKLVIVDFKTDINKTANELKNEHSEQLKLYASACSEIYGSDVKELIIYSFELGEAITI